MTRVRVAVAALLLLDLASRAPYALRWYGAEGWLPLALLWRSPLALWAGPYLVSEHPVWLGVMFGLHALAALGLLINWHGRTCAWACVALWGALHARNPLLGYGGDHLLRMLVFWLGCGQLGRRLALRGWWTRFEPTEAAKQGTIGSWA